MSGNPEMYPPKVEEGKVEETAQEWSEMVTDILMIAEARSGNENKREARHWEIIQKYLEDFYRGQADGHLIDHLEEQAAMIYDHKEQADPSAQMRGYVFEDLSRYTPLNHDLVVSFMPAELWIGDEPTTVIDDEEVTLREHPVTENKLAQRDWLAKHLDDLDQLTVMELKRSRPHEERIAWDKGAIIARQIRATLPPRENVFVYIPAEDDKFADQKARLSRGEVIIRFNPKDKGWIAEGNDPTQVQANQDLVVQANQLNQELSRSLTVPDAVVLENGKPVGSIETKCWQTEEVAALVQLLEEQKEGETLGGIVGGKQIDFARLFEGKSPQEREALNLILKLREEVSFVEESVGKIEHPLVVLRFPANIPPDEIEDLQEQLVRLGYKNVLIQQILLDADEIELIAKEFMTSQVFIKLLEKRYQEMKEGGHGFRNISSNDFRKNQKARALALGVELNDLKNYTPVRDNPTQRDLSISLLRAQYDKK
jgi:hypothetical protein